MSANFTPDMVGYKSLSPFRFWCQKTLPLVYDDSLSYYELLCKVVNYINNLITDVAAAEENVDRLLTAYNQLQEYVNDYFDSVDFQQKIDESLDRYAEDGTLSAMVNTHVRALLPYEVGQQIGDVVDEQLPPVVDLKLGAVVDTKLPDVVDDKLEDVVRPMIVPAVSGLLPQEVGRQLPDEVETQLPAAIGEDLGTIAPPVIQQWLNDHPDATTSVEDGSISLVKLNTALQRLARLDGNFYPTEYDPAVTYYTDDMCTYRNTLTDVEMAYKCIATSTTGTFSAADWAVVDENDIVINARAIYDLASSIAPVYRYPNNPAIPTGTIFFYRGNARNAPYGLWKATTDIPAAAFVTTSNAERVTILDLISTVIADLNSAIGDIKYASGNEIAPDTDGTIHGTIKGNIGETLTEGSQTAYWYARYTISANAELHVKTRQSTSSSYPYYIYFTDAVKKILSRQGPVTNVEGYVEYIPVIAPAGSVYMFVMSAGSTAYLGVAKSASIFPLQNQIDALNGDLNDLNTDYTGFKAESEAEITDAVTQVQAMRDELGDVIYRAGIDIAYDTDSIVAGVLNGNVGEIISRNSAGTTSYRNARYTLSTVRAFHVKTTTSTNNTYVNYVYFTDNDDKIISKAALKPDGTSGERVFNPVFAPDNATRMYVMAYTYPIDSTTFDQKCQVNSSAVYPLQDQISVMNAGKACYVDASAESGGDGSTSAPFNTITDALNNGFTDLIVKAGEYAPFSIHDKTAPVSVTLWEMPTSYDSANVPEAPKIVIKTPDGAAEAPGVIIHHCREVYLSDIHVQDVKADCYQLKNIDKLKCVRCFASGNDEEPKTDAETYMGFVIENTNGEFISCKAWDIDKDGFNIHKYGNTVFIDCVAHDCDDDGISHHDGCTGVIIGGEYYNCDKGGISSPTSGARINVNGAYCHDNTRHGIHVSGDSVARISNCLSVNNGVADIYVQDATAVGWGNVYNTKSVEGTGTFTEYPQT